MNRHWLSEGGQRSSQDRDAQWAWIVMQSQLCQVKASLVYTVSLG